MSKASKNLIFVFWVTLLIFGIFYYILFTKGFNLGWFLASMGLGILCLLID